MKHQLKGTLVIQVDSRPEWDFITSYFELSWTVFSKDNAFYLTDGPCIYICNDSTGINWTYNKYSHFSSVGYKIISFEQFTELLNVSKIRFL